MPLKRLGKRHGGGKCSSGTASDRGTTAKPCSARTRRRQMGLGRGERARVVR
ncbi:hypothetical protein FH972_023663 [Carpinus fangiana]|uniref:Uncharacterized protein n=1 Tax=Carpinus fangiana TaxID=176857 RepID=A0A5N6KVU3_9ROSI|nr:hypothetical protein FH972_023663 [Carpinus fangiana]